MLFFYLSCLFSPEYCLQVFIFRLFAFQTTFKSGETQGKKSPPNMFLHSLLLLIRLIAVSVWVSISVLAYISSRLNGRKQYVETLYLRMSCLNSKTEEDKTRIWSVCVGGGAWLPQPQRQLCHSVKQNVQTYDWKSFLTFHATLANTISPDGLSTAVSDLTLQTIHVHGSSEVDTVVLLRVELWCRLFQNYCFILDV